MTREGPPAHESIAQAPAHPARRLDDLFFVVGLFGCWLIFHPYQGNIIDAYLYVGHAMAAFEPHGVGQDWMFHDDGQMRFSIFPNALRWLIGAFGAPAASEGLAFFALVIWFAGLTRLASALQEGRQKWLLVFFTVLVRSQYSPFSIWTAEPLAIPRPFAEACVLFALASLLKGRDGRAIVLLMIAAALHPIMALAGVGVLFLFKGSADRRWRMAAAATLAALLAAAALKLPFAGRLFTPIDPQWRQALDPGLFPSSWPIDDWSVLIVDLATLALAAWRLQGGTRKLFLSTAAVAAGGLAASVLAADVLSSLLVIQAQPWRAAWLAGAVAPGAMAMLALESKGRPPAFWLAPSFLSLAWLQPHGAWGVSLVLAAAIAEIGKSRVGDALSRRMALAALAIGAFLSISALWNALEITRPAPEPLRALRQLVLAGNLNVWPLAAIGCLFAFGILPSRPAFKIGFGLVLTALALLLWDVRTESRREIEAGRRIPEFVSIIAQRPGEVFWGDGSDETWYLLGRPNWLAMIQSFSIVFSRDHAMLWKARSDRALALRLFKKRPTDDEPTLTSRRLNTFCSSADAPPWVVWPLFNDDKPPPNVSPRAVWRAPDPQAQFLKRNGQVQWLRTTSYMLLACRGGASS